MDRANNFGAGRVSKTQVGLKIISVVSYHGTSYGSKFQKKSDNHPFYVFKRNFFIQNSKIISIITIGCAAAAVHCSDYFMAIICLALILSVVSIIGQLVISNDNKSFKLADSVYHVFVALFLIGGAIFYFIDLDDVVSTMIQEGRGSTAQRNDKQVVDISTGEAYAAGVSYLWKYY